MRGIGKEWRERKKAGRGKGDIFIFLYNIYLKIILLLIFFLTEGKPSVKEELKNKRDQRRQGRAGGLGQQRQKVSLGKMADHQQNGGRMDKLMTRGPTEKCSPWTASGIPIKYVSVVKIPEPSRN